MGVLKYALLGLLNRQDLTGYDLSKALEGPLREFWSAKHSQIYPELRGLAEGGLIEYRTEISGTVLEKKVYSITPQGKAEFMHWAKTPNPMMPTPKDEFRLQLFFSDAITPEERLELLRQKLQQRRQRLEYLQGNANAFSELPPAAENEFSDYLVLLGAISREQAACSWLEECIRLCLQR